jgi:GNAT superfamily N-acetyltransferase
MNLKSKNIESVRRKYFPLKIKGGYSIRPVAKKEVMELVAKSYATVFPDRGDTPCFRMSPERRKKAQDFWKMYDVLHHEWFLFLDPKGKPIGWHMGEAEDFQTFYMRNTGILPEYQGRGLYRAFLKAFSAYLGELGYERISSQHKPTNKSILILKLKQGFVIGGFEMTENWGALVKMVKIIPQDRRESFFRQFGDMVHLEN